ncbi:hypothetical protein T01_8838 [Trichinella spiralis]|uniref:Uncharacterized protein n=1 Tax=Trichinella spiralis TaxID=6334 RepID=A0A0V1BNI6_TRISP|nr:hypothetical protein T01_8838 [Trichinella spiralis]
MIGISRQTLLADDQIWIAASVERPQEATEQWMANQAPLQDKQISVLRLICRDKFVYINAQTTKHIFFTIKYKQQPFRIL